MDAIATHAERVAFHLTGRRGATVRDAGTLRPALQARYRDLDTLRHDYPVVLASTGDVAAVSLTSLVDAVLDDAADLMLDAQHLATDAVGVAAGRGAGERGVDE